MVETRKYSEFVPDEVDRPVGLTDGQNTIGPEGSGGGNAPSDASYITRTDEAGLDNETALDSLGGDGIVKTMADGTPYATNLQGDGSTIQVTGGTGFGDPYIISSLGVPGGGSSIINQVAHGFSGGEWVRVRQSDGLYVDSVANTDENAETIGLVTEIINVDNFRVQQSGKVASFIAINAGIPYLPLTQGGVYFLSATDTGEITLTEADGIDQVSRASLVADGVDSGWILPYRGVINALDEGAGGTVPNNPNVIRFTQVGHGFSVGNWLRVSGSNTFALASVESLNNARAVGVVIDVVDADTFVLQTEGFNETQVGLTPGATYYLDRLVPGGMVPFPTGQPNEFIRPVYVALTSTSGFVLEEKPIPVIDSKTSIIVNQPGHGFIEGAAVRVLTDTQYTQAQANNLENSRAVGLIRTIDADNFILHQSGLVQVFEPPWLFDNQEQYYLSPSVPGILTSVEPTGPGEVSKPMFQAIDGTSGWILEQRPLLQPNANGGVPIGPLVHSVVTTGANDSTSNLFASAGIALNTQGIEVMTATINVVLPTSFIKVSISGNIFSDTAGGFVAFAVFRSDSSNSVGVLNSSGVGSSVRFRQISGSVYFLAGVSGPLTISVRMGPVRDPNVATLNLNGSGQSLPLQTSMQIEEIGVP